MLTLNKITFRVEYSGDITLTVGDVTQTVTTRDLALAFATWLADRSNIESSSPINSLSYVDGVVSWDQGGTAQQKDYGDTPARHLIDAFRNSLTVNDLDAAHRDLYVRLVDAIATSNKHTAASLADALKKEAIWTSN